MSIIIPGDKLPVDKQTLNSKKLNIGPAIYVDPLQGNAITVSNAGVFAHKVKKTKQLITVEASSKNYVPAVGDYVVGVVQGTFGEFFKVALAHFKAPAILPYMAFENATKKNRPNLKVGALVYAKVSAYDPNIDVEIECVNSTTGKADGFGELVGGNLVELDLAYARYLLFNDTNEVLVKLSKRCQFEVAIGVNGRIWVRAGDLRNTAACSEYLQRAQHAAPTQLEEILAALWKKYSI